MMIVLAVPSEVKPARVVEVLKIRTVTTVVAVVLVSQVVVAVIGMKVSLNPNAPEWNR